MELPSDICSADDFEDRFVIRKEGRILSIGIDGTRIDGVIVPIDLLNEIPFYKGPFSHCELRDVLQFSARPWLLAENVQWILPRGATLFVSVPWMQPYSDDFWRISPRGVGSLFPLVKWTALQLVNNETMGFGVKA